ncbi:hypothetical protein MKEN_00911700 [Mycena kentingensis (nom. inval.)]|nr:hypothetical protein MKEN_00911700 [Mycena kentingensis (nom. inval.)]
MSNGSETTTGINAHLSKTTVYGDGSSLRSRSKRSLHAHHPTDSLPFRRPIDTFRSSVRKVMAMKRSTTILASIGAGAEPGVDPRRASMDQAYGHVQRDCTIEVVDYSAVSANSTTMKNAEFVKWAQSPQSERAHWVKVRWINICGISWDVIKAVSLRHELHPLALEDVLHNRPENLSKAEYFLHHLFLRVLVHDVETDASKPLYSVDELSQDPSAPQSENAIRQRQIEQAKIDALKQGTLRVSVTPMFIFLFRDGTVISLTSHAPPELTQPISDRLRRPDTILRTSVDPSMLVDKAVQVIDSYHNQISSIEREILIKPKPTTVRKLHIVSGDLVLHKRTLEPIKTLVYGLRRYDVDRCAALVDQSDPKMKGQKIVGFMSHKAKIYLADTFDHTEYIISTLDMIAGIGDSLTDYSFNMASYSMNDTMRVLTMITIICLPLTFVSGYFGMNFTGVTWTTEWSDVLFWIIAIPCVIVISPLFIIPDIKRMIHYFQTKRLLSVTTRKLR